MFPDSDKGPATGRRQLRAPVLSGDEAGLSTGEMQREHHALNIKQTSQIVESLRDDCPPVVERRTRAAPQTSDTAAGTVSAREERSPVIRSLQPQSSVAESWLSPRPDPARPSMRPVAQRQSGEFLLPSPVSANAPASGRQYPYPNRPKEEFSLAPSNADIMLPTSPRMEESVNYAGKHNYQNNVKSTAASPLESPDPNYDPKRAKYASTASRVLPFNANAEQVISEMRYTPHTSRPLDKFSPAAM